LISLVDVAMGADRADCQAFGELTPRVDGP
jgi:hypothetical protein